MYSAYVDLAAPRLNHHPTSYYVELITYDDGNSILRIVSGHVLFLNIFNHPVHLNIIKELLIFPDGWYIFKVLQFVPCLIKWYIECCSIKLDYKTHEDIYIYITRWFIGAKTRTLFTIQFVTVPNKFSARFKRKNSEEYLHITSGNRVKNSN